MHAEPEAPEALRCPRCNGECMHMEDVTTFARESEDGQGTKVRVALNHTYARHDLFPFVLSGRLERNDSPSDRRDAVAIKLRCESCRVVSALVFVQHKGETSTQWCDPADVRGLWHPRSAATSPTGCGG